MQAKYQYPLPEGVTTSELIKVTDFYQQVEQLYERHCDRATFLAAYQAFKAVIPSKAEEKQLDRDFQKESGYSIYRAVKFVQTHQRKQLKYTDA